MKKNLSLIMQTAWNFFRTSGGSFSQCLRKSWANYKLVEQMQAGMVTFRFLRKDGTMRVARGTLANHLVPPVGRTTTRQINDAVQVYWDIERSSWRSFRKFNLIF
ncbi:MAG: SH3 beta-barrel fold-containing protein [Bacteroides sp.]|nr:SH3 beta-barrel fold-containing protein [Bacteroides sp.]